MREITSFGDAGEVLVQLAEEGAFTKRFSIVDADGDVIFPSLIPCFAYQEEDVDCNGDVVQIPSLPESIELSEWANITGLAYIPRFFYEEDKCPEEVKLGFGLIEKKGTSVEQPIENSEVSSVEELSAEAEATRNSMKEGKSFSDKLLEMVHERGTVTYRLGTIETELQKLEEDYQEKIREFSVEKIAVLEVIDTYDKAIRIFCEGK